MKTVELAGAEYIHLDVMDGLFVPNISFGAPVIASCRPVSGMFFDTHLMIQEPIRYIENFVKAGSDLINVHVEACSDCMETLRAIHECGKKTGITVKPATPVSAVAPYLDEVDLILIMSVEPGFGGQKFMPIALDKLREARELITQCGKDIELEVDGGINTANAKQVIEAGANVLVAGSAVFGASDKAAAIEALRHPKQ